MILVDTSVFINYFKGRETAATLFLENTLDHSCWITSLVYQELLQGARDEKEFDILRVYISSQFFCHPTDPIASYEKAAKIFFDCKRKGITIRSTIDCLIAQIAIEHNIPLLHDDDDFVKIAKIAPLKLAL